MTLWTIIGGGPSVNSIEWSEEAFPNVIAANNAWETAPWAKILVFGDSRWWQGWDNKTKVLENFKGRIITDSGVSGDDRIERRMRTADEKLIDSPNHVLAPDSGSKAMCVAYHEGAKKIQLAGFDLCADKYGQTHFHDNHRASPAKGWEHLFYTAHGRLVRLLRERGVEVVRITNPGHEDIPYEPPQSFANL